MPEMMELESYWMPKLQEHQFLGLQSQFNNLNRIYEAAMPGMVRNTQMYNEAMAPIMGNIAKTSRESYMLGLGGGAETLNTLTSQANAALARGRELDPQELEYATQLARAATTARGVAGGNQGIAAEVLNSNTLRNQREAINRQFATQVFGLNQGVANAGYQLYGQPLAANAASLSPLSMMGLGREGLQNLGPNFLQPESGYNAQLIGMNNKMAFDASAGAAAGKNSMVGAGIGAVATIAGAAI